MKEVKNYLRLIKFSHTIFAMPFALIGFCLGVAYHKGVNTGNFTDYERMKIISGFSNREIEPRYIILLVLVILCMVFARSAAMAFNRYLDRDIDAKNPRTAMREIPQGIITPRNALIFTIVNCLLFVATSFFINELCFFLSPVALMVVLGYSYTKRFTPFCHLVLGLGLSLAPLGAYLAVTGKFSLLPVVFSLSVLFWVSGFDIIYALQDEEFDKLQKLYSIPAWLGKYQALRVSEILHLLSAVAVIVAGFYGGFGWLYGMGAIIFFAMLIYQHSLVKPNDLRKVDLAFMTANGIASVVFAIFVIADLFTSL